MRKNRKFTLEDLKEYSTSKGYVLEFHRYKKVFTLRKAEKPAAWSWVYFPHTEDKLVELVDDLTYEGWLFAIDRTIREISEPDKINL
ncbi:hypothetical protein [Escherichia sp. MOD1-EC6153]|uniref:hypothetical protein n=1 Tax=Escherichia sp. MOD1-EC6153 TaxID=2093891 RepID=UPI000CF75B5A|nr:hypothetical protein [Escherichia sp. MOD1-EC6153]MBB8060742.1 hypothetical protein [Escherichia coli]